MINFFITLSMSFLIVLFAILLMGIGRVFGRESICGSCGNVARRACKLCSSECRDDCDTATVASPLVSTNDAEEYLWH